MILLLCYNCSCPPRWPWPGHDQVGAWCGQRGCGWGDGGLQCDLLGRNWVLPTSFIFMVFRQWLQAHPKFVPQHEQWYHPCRVQRTRGHLQLLGVQHCHPPDAPGHCQSPRPRWVSFPHSCPLCLWESGLHWHPRAGGGRGGAGLSLAAGGRLWLWAQGRSRVLVWHTLRKALEALCGVSITLFSWSVGGDSLYTKTLTQHSQTPCTHGHTHITITHAGDFSGVLVVRTALPMQGAWVWSPVGELRFLMPHDTAEKKRNSHACITDTHMCTTDT